MRRNGIWAAGLAAAVLAAAPAAARTEHAVKISATGFGIARVHPKNRMSNAAIVDAVVAAFKIANQRAFHEARDSAHEYAKAADRKLVRLIGISDNHRGSGSYAPFGPNRYCGTIRIVVGPFVRGHPPTLKTVRRCFIPRFVSRSLTLKYLAS